ncbi:hypothetical protein HPP92_020300 [Vanilla planifolia]|uniref:U3 small nucleolar RNA-associated protein 13 C-terminal domain-containing protein n=1 Tax=Vanilla planifolia TaxID=51239 RepID=A0A835UEU9_VANPL|nr:hypothetical protein HPP92_020701 [Vanilla planifolia]KAG0461824.1 hypothetical protein HPP92_020300 [Vanilla planifolia]
MIANVWALAVSRKSELLATGGEDAIINLWYDSTAADKSKAFKRKIIEVKGIRELLEGLIPYSQRHFSRIDRLVRSSFLLDYILNGMAVIEPENSVLQHSE